MNMYAYVGGDPVNFRDPSGTCTYSGGMMVDGLWVGDVDVCLDGNGSGGFDFFGFNPFDYFGNGGFGGGGQAGGNEAPASDPSPQNNQPKPDPCNSLGNRIGNALENAGKGISYSGLTIAGIGAFAGPEGAVPGLFITEVDGILSTVGQVSQDIAFGRPITEIAGRALVNTLGARALNNVIPKSVRSGIGDAIFGQTIGEIASATNDWLDPNRCPK